MPNGDHTSAEIATLASDILRDESASEDARELAGSALSQTAPPSHTSERMAELASRVLNDPTSGEREKSLAGSILEQA